jgi:hypothetical protein
MTLSGMQQIKIKNSISDLHNNKQKKAKQYKGVSNQSTITNKTIRSMAEKCLL